MLWPINYQQAIIVKCVHKTHEAAYRLVESLLTTEVSLTAEGLKTA